MEGRSNIADHFWADGHRKVLVAAESHTTRGGIVRGYKAAYNFARRLKTLSSLTPGKYACKDWASEPDKFIGNPIHQMP